MFEAAELGRKVSKDEFERLEQDLHTQLLEAQRWLRNTGTQVFVITAGVPGAGRSDLVNRLNEWLDTRDMRTYAFWDETDEERERPYMWRFWRAMPPRGTIGIMFGSWYALPITHRVLGEIDDDAFESALDRIVQLERMLADDGAIVLKFWLHLPAKEQARRLQMDLEEAKKTKHWKPHPLTHRFAKHYEPYAQTAERVIRHTDTRECQWFVVESTDRRYRDLTVGQTLLDALQRRRELDEQASSPEVMHENTIPQAQSAEVTILDKVDLSATLERGVYKKRLKKCQRELYHLAWLNYDKQRSTVLVFEGWDGAGKGGAIRRITRALDARLYRVLSVGAPTDEECAQHYLWRFWRQVPRAGYVTIYDRSWYGRVLVERVEGFATEAQWMRAYREINEFEEALADRGIVLLKFWLHIDPDEQHRRFKERERVPWKRHKITPEDWRNREKWDQYRHAVNDMVERTSSAHAPWQIIAGNDKHYARVEVLKTICERLQKDL
jgi:polyphosphate:AMP phosphotransferase